MRALDEVADGSERVVLRTVPEELIGLKWV